jgi:hypothetical protein
MFTTLNRATYYLAVLILILFSELLFSQTSGKLKGIVLDATGNPLKGAQVIILETAIKAKTGRDGYYYIIGVRAGTYSVRTEFEGYTPNEVRKVEVRVICTLCQGQ